MKKFIRVYFLLVCLAVGLCCSSVQAVESASAALLFKIARPMGLGGGACSGLAFKTPGIENKIKPHFTLTTGGGGVLDQRYFIDNPVCIDAAHENKEYCIGSAGASAAFSYLIEGISGVGELEHAAYFFLQDSQSGSYVYQGVGCSGRIGDADCTLTGMVYGSAINLASAGAC